MLLSQGITSDNKLYNVRGLGQSMSVTIEEIDSLVSIRNRFSNHSEIDLARFESICFTSIFYCDRQNERFMPAIA